MKRSTALRRTARLRPRRPTVRKSSRIHDTEYMARVRELPCQVVVDPGPVLPTACDGAMHAHHAGDRGLGQKCSDMETVPFCQRHHAEWHDCRDSFAGMSKEQRRDYARSAILQTQLRLSLKDGES